MKKTIAVALVLLILLLTGCAEKEEAKFMHPCPDDMKNEETFFDTERTHYPSEEDFQSIQKGMYFYEVVEILGKPHEGVIISLSGYHTEREVYRWDTENGRTCWIRFWMNEYGYDNFSNEEIAAMSLWEWHQYTTVYMDLQWFEDMPEGYGETINPQETAPQ